VKADSDYFYNSIQNLDRDSLIQLAVKLHAQLQELKIRQEENKRIETEVHIQYSELKEKYDELLVSYDAVVKDNAQMHDKLCLRNKAIFGSHTEKFLSNISENVNSKEIEDESQIENSAEDENDSKIKRVTSFNEKKSDLNKPVKRKTCVNKRKSGLKDSAAKLPRRISYKLDAKALNEKYGEGNWSIDFWKRYETIEKILTPEYLNVVYEPVINVDNTFLTKSYDDKLIPHSLVSASLFASIIYNKFVLSLPFYRQSADFFMHGLMLSKQTIIKWTNTLVPSVLEPISEYMLSLLAKQKYVQSDETYLLVLKDGRASSTKSYLWIHCTSEFSDDKPIVAFCYEPTRSTEHLRKIFGDFTGYMTSDAYISYSVMEEETNGCFRVTGCMMHCRRYFAEALFVNDTTAVPEEKLREMPEVKALLIMGDIYRAENKLKNLSSKERLGKRKTDVEPLVDKFFEYIRSLENTKEQYSDRMQKAIGYAINQEQYLRRFLEDGSVPIDNGESERHICSYAKGRSNWLFADTKLGAKVNATCYTIAETAKANGVNPKIYFTYLLEQVPKHMAEENYDWKADMMPWSDAYQKYESSYGENNLCILRALTESPERPVVKKTITKGTAIPTKKVI